MILVVVDYADYLLYHAYVIDLILIRAVAGLTQEQLGVRLELSQAQVSRYEGQVGSIPLDPAALVGCLRKRSIDGAKGKSRYRTKTGGARSRIAIFEAL